MKLKLVLFLFCCLSIFGCAPSSSSTVKSESQNLPTRPEVAGDILNRELLNTQDQRVSYCEILENQISTYSGYRDTELLPLASTSKLITTAWALDQLGPHFQFKIELFLNPINSSQGLYDVFLKSNYDPIVNIEKLLFILSELNQAGVKHIRHLGVDKSTRVFLGVLMNPHLELDQIPTSSSESMSNLKLIFNSKNWAEKTKQAQLNLQEWGLSSHKKINLPDYFITDDVSLLSPEQMNPANYPIKKVIQSAPLLKYLKNMNVFSNNYLADSLFSLLGGSSAYAAFQKNKLKLSQKELVLLTGSGLPLIVNDQRRDNLGSCFAMIKVLSYIHNIAKESKLNLGSILLNPTSDLDGTFSASLQYNQAIVLKTGRLFDVPALNAVGFVSTTQGMLSFVFLGHDFSNNEADEIDQSRFEMIQNIFSHYQIQPQFISTDYKDIFL